MRYDLFTKRVAKFAPSRTCDYLCDVVYIHSSTLLRPIHPSGVVANVNEMSLIVDKILQNLNGRVEIKFVCYYRLNIFCL